MPADRAEHVLELADDGAAATAAAREPLYVVRVRDRVDERIAGHPGRAYTSPPQPHHSALALVALLLGGTERPATGPASWTRAVPGGQRTIALAPSARGA